MYFAANLTPPNQPTIKSLTKVIVGMKKGKYFTSTINIGEKRVPKPSHENKDVNMIVAMLKDKERRAHNTCRETRIMLGIQDAMSRLFLDIG
jgi:hypothetical protein